MQVYFASTPASIEYIRVGRPRALAVTTATRSDALPDIPTVGEFLPGYEASQWYGVGVLLNAIYEEDFLGFSYGFRPGRGTHDALDALCVGIHSRKVSWILDADIPIVLRHGEPGMAHTVRGA